MSADSWYLGLALSLEISLKALTAQDIWQFNVFQNMGSRSEKWVFNTAITLVGWHILGCAGSKCKSLKVITIKVKYFSMIFLILSHCCFHQFEKFVVLVCFLGPLLLLEMNSTWSHFVLSRLSFNGAVEKDFYYVTTNISYKENYLDMCNYYNG